MDGALEPEATNVGIKQVSHGGPSNKQDHSQSFAQPLAFLVSLG
jgi:hypothetical protein